MKISRLFLGNSNAYLVVSGSESAIIDGGLGDRSEQLIAELGRHGAAPESLKYLAVTHAHYDHVGSFRSLKAMFPSAQIVAHELEAGNLQKGLSPVPAGTMWFSRPVSWLGCLIFKHCIKFRGFNADLTFTSSLLGSLGGEEIEFFHTPGHSAGSMSVRLGRHAVFAGDTLFHILPGQLYPPFADAPEQLMESWRRIIASGCPVIFPGHGRAIPIGLLRAVFEKKSR